VEKIAAKRSINIFSAITTKKIAVARKRTKKKKRKINLK
jgi:hypothetical protein